MSKIYLVAWDNGLNASGVFPYEFATEAEAQQFGSDWASEMNAQETDYNGYSFEVITGKSAPKPIPPKPEIWTACIQLSITGPRVISVRKRKQKRASTIPQHVREFLSLEPGTNGIAGMTNEEARALKRNDSVKAWSMASDGDVLKVSEKYHGLRRWVTFKLQREHSA